MTTPTMVMVRAQASGGKYIGPKVTTAPVLSVLVNGQRLIPDVTIPNNGSGVVKQPQDPTSSPYTVVVQPPPSPINGYPVPGTYWLDPPAPPDQDEAQITVPLPLSGPTPVQFQVTAYAPRPVVSSVTVTIDPAKNYTTQPGIVVPVPGLYLPTFTVTPQGGGQVNVAVTLQMMCGCPITQQPQIVAPPSGTEMFWPSTEFTVSVVFRQIQAAHQVPVVYTFDLSCTQMDQFGANVSVPPGNYQVFILAVQHYSDNSNVATAWVQVT